MYNIGTLIEFNTWEYSCKVEEHIPEDGRIGKINGVLSEDSQRTFNYSKSYPHLTNEDSYCWSFGDYPKESATVYSLEEIIVMGFFNGVYK